MKSLPALMAVAVLLFSGAAVFAQTLYKWTDDQGNVHFADTPVDVPPKFRNQVETSQIKVKVEKKTPDAKGKPGEDAKAPQKAEEPIPVGESGEANAQPKLKTFEVPFKAYEGTARRIIIDVRFNGSVTAPMILDTGAPGLVISPRLAEKIGVFEKDGGKLLMMAGGIGGSVPAIYTIIDSVEIGGASDAFIPATITPSISGGFEGLLGMDFMANYSFNVDTSRNMLVMTEHPHSLSRPGGHDETWWKINYRNFSMFRAGWKKYYEQAAKEESSRRTDKATAVKNFAKWQSDEAEKLFSKLDRYASQNTVPPHWRKY